MSNCLNKSTCQQQCDAHSTESGWQSAPHTSATLNTVGRQRHAAHNQLKRTLPNININNAHAATIAWRTSALRKRCVARRSRTPPQEGGTGWRICLWHRSQHEQHAAHKSYTAMMPISITNTIDIQRQSKPSYVCEFGWGGCSGGSRWPAKPNSQRNECLCSNKHVYVFPLR